MEAKFLERLNPAQRAAALHGDAPLLIIAGAGTGKTNTLAHRVAQLILKGVRPERVLLLTFSRRAAQELSRRSQAIVGSALKTVLPASAAARLTWAGTFHSVANRLLRQYAAHVGLDPGFGVMDRGDSADLLDVARHELGYSAQGGQAFRARTPASRSTRTASIRSGRSTPRSPRRFPGARSGSPS